MGTVYKARGLMGFYAGIPASYMRVCVVTIPGNVAYEVAKEMVMRSNGE
jgi:hypothetical protein